MKPTTIRFSNELTKKLTELAINEAILEEKKVSRSEMLRRLVNQAYYKLTKRKGK